MLLYLPFQTDFTTRLHESEAFSDCKVICGPYHFNTHKTILCSQSEYFLKALKSGTFKGPWLMIYGLILTRAQEGETGVLTLKAISDDAENKDDSCDDPEIVKLMIEFFYHFDYLRTPAPASTPATATSFLVEHARVFAMAIKYQIDGLRQLAAKKFKQTASVHWNHEDFAHAIHVVYTSTVDDVQELRAIVADTINDHLNDLQDKDEIEVVVSSLGGLAYSLLKRKNPPFCCARQHKGEGLHLVCPTPSCAFSFDICKQCHRTRQVVYCPFCVHTIKLG